MGIWPLVPAKDASIVIAKGCRSDQTISGGFMQTVSQLLKLKGNQIFSVAPQESVLRAIEIMATRYVGALLVMNEGTLLGIISERDYARKVILKNRAPR